MKYIQLRNKNRSSNLVARINPDSGQVVSLSRGDLSIEYMHPGGLAPEDRLPATLGWKNSELLMFPIVGQTLDNTVMFEGNEYALDKHGILRAMQPEIISLNDSSIVLQYQYAPGTVVDNSTRGKPPAQMSLPIGFDVKKLHLVDDSFKTGFLLTNTGEKTFCYSFGWHPAFRSPGEHLSRSNFYGASGPVCTLADVFRNGNGALFLEGVELLRYSPHNPKLSPPGGSYGGVEVSSNFGNTMLWSDPESRGSLVCIEPVVEKKPLGTKIDLSPGGSYKQTLFPGESAYYWVNISVY